MTNEHGLFTTKTIIYYIKKIIINLFLIHRAQPLYTRGLHGLLQPSGVHTLTEKFFSGRGCGRHSNALRTTMSEICAGK